MWDVIHAGKLGAIDGGLKAAGGVVLAKGVGRIAKPLASSASAPLAVASILVDIGKEYLGACCYHHVKLRYNPTPVDYRQQVADRTMNRMTSKASEQIIMREFRQNVGHHVVSGTAAAAGAGIGAMTWASAVSYFSTGAALAGPVGFLAATGVALAGGMAGYYSGSALYHKTTFMYFKSHDKAKEDIKRLEFGAKVLFSEYDPGMTGSISCEDCETLIVRLQAASRNSVSDTNLTTALGYLRDRDRRTRPISWEEFWDWVSIQALARLDALEVEVESETAPPKGKKGGGPKVLQMPNMYPEVVCALQFLHPGTRIPATVSLVLQAKLEHLVELNAITQEEQEQFLEQLQYGSPSERRALSQRIDQLSKTPPEGISTGFNEKEAEEEEMSEDAEQIDVLCSLLSDEGVRRLLEDHGVDTTGLPDRGACHAVAVTLAGELSRPRRIGPLLNQLEY